MLIPLLLTAISLQDAIQRVETGGERDPAHAIGDHGLARGYLQIRAAYHQDALEWAVAHGKPLPPYATTCASEAHSRACMGYYWARYGAKTDRDRALCHHYGPGWRKMADRHSYWAKVKTAMQAAP